MFGHDQSADLFINHFSCHYCGAILSSSSAFLMVVLNRKITFGPNDWLLLVCSVGIPAVPGAIFAALGYFGSDGFW